MGYYETDRCPHCQYILERRRGVWSRSIVGPPVVACPKCKGLVRTGQDEWENLNLYGKFEVWLQTVWFAFGSTIFLGFIVYFLFGVRVLAAAFIGGLVGVALTVWVTIREIRESRKRNAHTAQQRAVQQQQPAQKQAAGHYYWIMSQDQELQGPFTAEQIPSEAGPETWVSHQGQWAKLKDHPDFARKE